MGRARGLMESLDPGYRGIVAGRGLIIALPNPARRVLLPGKRIPCSRAGNTPHTVVECPCGKRGR